MQVNDYIVENKRLFKIISEHGRGVEYIGSQNNHNHFIPSMIPKNTKLLEFKGKTILYKTTEEKNHPHNIKFLQKRKKWIDYLVALKTDETLLLIPKSSKPENIMSLAFMVNSTTNEKSANCKLVVRGQEAYIVTKNYIKSGEPIHIYYGQSFIRRIKKNK